MLRCPKCRRSAKLKRGDFPVTCVCGTRYESSNDMKAGRASSHKPAPISVPDYGPGTELKAIFTTLGQTESLGCACEALAKQMNVWGVEGCRKNRPRIIKQIRETAEKKSWGDTLWASAAAVKSGLALQINPLDRFGSLVDLAIQRAESRAS